MSGSGPSTRKGRAFCFVLLMMAVVASLLSFYYDTTTLTSLPATVDYPALLHRLFQDQPKSAGGDVQDSLWWREVLCTRGDNETDGGGPKTVALKHLFRDVTPGKDNNVFLMDTACNPKPKYRVWCSVESWARQNPSRKVWFLLTSGRLDGFEELPSSLLQQYTNLQMVTADLNDLFRDTPLLALFRSRRWMETWPVELLSDMLRVLVLWWWGGVYSDTDVISVRPLTLSPNSLGFENPGQLGSAFYSFCARHPALLVLMEDMQRNFEPKAWGSIGPRAISRVMMKLCEDKLQNLIRKAPVTCSGNITLHPTSTFFLIRYDRFKKYFSPGGGKNFNQTFGRAFALHFWNKLSKKTVVKVNDNSIYEVAAKSFCPITYYTATADSDVF